MSDTGIEPHEVGPAKMQALVIPGPAGLAGAAFARVFGVAFTDLARRIAPHSGALVALGLDAAAIFLAYRQGGKGDAILVAAAIVASLAFLPRVQFAVQPPPVG